MSYKVGYKNPPKNTRFKPGQSGNPHGRRGKQQSAEIEPPKQSNEKAPASNARKSQGLGGQEITLQLGNPHGRRGQPQNPEAHTPKQSSEKNPVTDAGKSQEPDRQEVTLQQLCRQTMDGDAASSIALAKIVQRQLKEEEEEKARKDVLAPLANNPDRAALLKLWRELYKSTPPAHISRKLLTMAIAYKLQEKAYGGLKPSTRRYLRKVAAAADAGRPIPMPTPVLPPGSRLLREWHGTTYEVVVLEKGVEFNGKNYRSLTEVASLITGVHWSGPAFFGLRKKQGR